MWEKTGKIKTTLVTKEQMWKLYQNVDNYPVWDTGIEWTRLHGEFVEGAHYTLKPKGGPEVDIEITELVENIQFDDVTYFFGAKMYGYHSLEEKDGELEISVTMGVEGWLAWFWIMVVAKGIIEELPETFNRQIRYAESL